MSLRECDSLLQFLPRTFQVFEFELDFSQVEVVLAGVLNEIEVASQRQRVLKVFQSVLAIAAENICTPPF